MDETTKLGVIDYVEPFSIELEEGTKAVKEKSRPLTPVQVETLKKQQADWTVSLPPQPVPGFPPWS